MDLTNVALVTGGWDGRSEVLLGQTAHGLPVHTQGPLIGSCDPRDELRRLHEQCLTPDQPRTVPGAPCGAALRVTFHEPMRWAATSSPSCFAVPLLFRPATSPAAASPSRSYAPAATVGDVCVPWHVVRHSSEEVHSLEAAGRGHRHAASGNSGAAAAAAGWRGMAVSVPYMPGGGTSSGAVGPSAEACQEAVSGAWLRQLESGRLLRTCAPGLAAGCFGAWASDRAPCPAAEGDLTHEEGVAGAASAFAAAAAAVAEGTPSSGAGVFDNVWLEDADEEEEPQSPVSPSQQVTPEQSTPSARAAAEADYAAPGGAAGAADTRTVPAPGLSSIALGSAPVAALAASSESAAAAAVVLPQQWAVRGGWDNLAGRWESLRPRLAHRFGFELDTFQKEAVLHLEAGHSVFVAAHTSAGKTVVAEYALALATQHCTRAIYTSPIKTISNQKYRDFSAKFEVGLLTGDVQIKPEAACLIMTTEILRSMLYRGADLIRDVEWVIFDEVHYVNDAERGVVWEEVIIMLPPHVGLVLLSATVPNVMDFADWVGRTKRKVMYVTGTTHRPVPLEHSLYYNGELYPIYARDTFLVEGHRAAMTAWKRKTAAPDTKRDEKAQRPNGRGTDLSGAARGGGGGSGASPSKHFGGSADNARRQVAGASRGSGPNSGPSSMRTERQQLLELVHTLGKRNMLPLAVFCFSKKRCDSGIDAVGTSLDLTTSAEKHAIHIFVEKCLSRLKDGDRRLPQVLRLRELLRRGLAVHHAGLLPIMKEIVEMLFCQGVIKLLMCTETFAMGVNAPTKTVMFHSIRKHDGKSFRYLLPGEYTQMAGRAGRRGLDTVGHVLIACWDDIPDDTTLRNVLQGKGVQLSSQFRLTYSMILNMLRVEDLKVEDMLKRSFAEWRAQKLQPQAQADIKDVEGQLQALASRAWPACISGCSRGDVEDYYDLCFKLDTLNSQLQASIMGSKAAQQALIPGRVVLYQNPVNALSELAVVLGPVGDEARSASGSAAAPSAAGTAAAAAAAAAAGAAGGTGGGEGLEQRRYYLLVLHTPGAVDAKHMHSLAAAAAAAAAASGSGRRLAVPAPPLMDEFKGMVLKSVSKAGAAKRVDPGTLPRYEEIGGMSALLVEAPSRQLVGVAKSKIKVETEAILCCGGDWGPTGCRKALADALRALGRLQETSACGEPELLDPRQDFKINDMASVEALAERSALLGRRRASRCHRCHKLSDQLAVVRDTATLAERRAVLTHQLSDASLQQMPDFHLRVAVLTRLGYIDGERSVQLKGRACCEVSSTQDELVATEALFAGLLTDLTPPEAVALLSALVFQEKSDVTPVLPPRLAEARKQLALVVEHTARVQQEEGLDIEPREYVASVMHCGLMQVVYEWALGTPFDEICTLTDVMEGSIVRAMVRLDGACGELRDAARVMGNTALFQQMEAASLAVRRDVIFAASLYVS